MSTVNQYVAAMIQRQIDEQGLVVWYDPEKAYTELTAELGWPNTTFVRYDGSFIKLRRTIDPLMKETQPPRLVVYVPVEREQTAGALIELDSAGVVMQPRQQPPACNTRLSVVARNALKPILGDDQVVEIEKQVEAGKLTLSDLNSLAEQGLDISTGVVKLIFGTANPQEVGITFLHSNMLDSEVLKKEASKELCQLMQIAFEIELNANDSLDQWRTKLCRHILLTDLVASLKSKLPQSLESVSHANGLGSTDACVRLARTWRNSREYRDSYVAAANRIEDELLLNQQDLAVDSLLDNETFLCCEIALLSHVETKLLEQASPELLQLAERRLSRFWADVVPAVQARWALISSATEVLLESDRVGQEIKNAPSSVSELVNRYTREEQPWCLLDTHHRHMESRKYNFEFAVGDEHKGLEKLIAKAEERYMEVGSKLAKHFVTNFAKAKHPIAGLLRQRDFFEKQVKPQLGEGKVAYVWVDALRFEMARELTRLLTDDFTIDLTPGIGTMPTITEIGMASLLPKAHESAKVVSIGGGKLAVEIAGKVIKDRKDRMAFMKEHAGVSVFEAKLEDLLPKPSKKVKDGIQSNDLILITSQEIDELGESGNTTQARLQLDGVLGHLRRGVRVLADHGIKTIVIAADHGHLFGDEIGDDMKIESPGGKVEDLHRRVWVGIGGASDPAYMRASLSSLGVESEFDIATPWTFATFKTHGFSRSYFHGGLSPQELIVPVAVLHSNAKRLSTSTGIEWILTPGTSKLTTRFFSVQIVGKQTESSLFGFEPPKVRIELRANKKCVSTPVSASYGFEDATGEVKLRISEVSGKSVDPNTVTVMVSEDITQKTVGVYLLDATTGAELVAPLTIDVAISM
jgi:hypothetical protein